MNNILWSILLVGAATGVTFPALAGNSSTDYSFIVDRLWYGCQHFGKTYQDISTFETANFYVNLCQKGNQYFYLGTAKNKSVKSNFIPAYATNELNTYQADNGNVSYIVEIKSTEPTLIVQRNGKTVIVETAFSPNCPQVIDNHQKQLNISIISELDYGNNEIKVIGDRLYWKSNQNYVSKINIDNKFLSTGIYQPQSFTSVPQKLWGFSSCF